MRARKYLAGVIATVMAVAILGACGQQTTSDSSSEQRSVSDSQAITIVDQRDKEVKLDKPAEKVAITVMPAPAIVAAVDGSWERIVGMNQSSIKAANEGITGKIFTTAADTVPIAGDDFVPNMEAILGLDPDVVIQWGNKTDDIVAPIESAGIPVVGLKYGTQEDLEAWITMFGQVLGKEDRSKDIIDTMHSEAAALKEQTVALSSSPRVLQLSYNDSKLGVSTGKDYAQYVFDLINATNVAKDAVVDDAGVSPEQIIAWDPEVVFLSAFDTSTPEDLYKDARFADVSAVKNKRVYRSPLGVYRWQVPCAESPLYWNWAAALVHPELEIDLPGKMREQIKYMYNYELTQEDIELTLRTDINNGSANYDHVQ